MTDLQAAKALVLDYYAELDLALASHADIGAVIAEHTGTDYRWRGMHPWYEQSGAAAVADEFWRPLSESLAALQRRQDVFLAGANDVDGGASTWVASMGHLMGLFDHRWLGIPPTGKMLFVRYAEFHRVHGGAIAETALFCDVISVMQQAGHYPLPPQTGAAFIHPGPLTHDGLLFDPQDPVESAKTMAVVNQMIGDLDESNRIAEATGDDRVPPEELAKTWHEDMIWYGPAGIGSSYTMLRYQQQHQYPFRLNLTEKVFNGHVARIAEGTYGGFFGWSNLTNTPMGGFLGMPGNEVRADMRVVDIYRREGEKLAENWVFIDLLHWLSMQGLDVLRRMRENLPGAGGP